MQSYNQTVVNPKLNVYTGIISIKNVVNNHQSVIENISWGFISEILDVKKYMYLYWYKDVLLAAFYIWRY